MKRMISPSRLGDLLEDGLEAVLELAAVLRAGDERAEVERDDALVLQRLGHVALDDALREALDDRGLADARLADQHGVVLRAAREHLHDAADLVVAADDRVELALARELGEVAAVLLEGLVAVLGVLVGHALVAADLLEHTQQRVARDAGRGRAPRRRGSSTPTSASSRCSVETYWSFRLSASRSACLRTPSSFGETCVCAPCVRGREASDSRRRARTGAGVRAQLAEGGRDDAALLREQRPQQVLGRHLGVIGLLGRGLRRDDRLLSLHRELVESHVPSDLRSLEGRLLV